MYMNFLYDDSEKKYYFINYNFTLIYNIIDIFNITDTIIDVKVYYKS